MSRVLIVDDEPSNIELLSGILKNKAEIQAATSGKIAIKICSKRVPDYVLLDVVMPEMNGFETLKEIKQLPGAESIQFIFISGNEDQEEIALAQSLGAKAFITKPIDPNKLFELLEIE